MRIWLVMRSRAWNTMTVGLLVTYRMHLKGCADLPSWIRRPDQNDAQGYKHVLAKNLKDSGAVRLLIQIL